MKPLTKARVRRYGLIFVSLAIALGGTQLLTTFVFYPSLPKIRPEFPRNVITIAIDQVQRWQLKLSGHSPTLPPPWTFSDYLPPKPNLRPTPPPPTIRPTQTPRTTPKLTSRPTPQPPVIRFRTPTPLPPTPPPTPPPTYPPIPPPGGGNSSTLEQETIAIINQRRAAIGLPALIPNAQLSSAARGHSQDMSQNNFCGHSGSDNSSPWERVNRAGYTGTAMGEVVGCGYLNPAGVVNGWWNSTGHHAILTDPNAAEIGVGWAPSIGSQEARQTGITGRR